MTFGFNMLEKDVTDPKATSRLQQCSVFDGAVKI